MQGRQHFQPQQPIATDLDALIPASHRLRKINNRVDFSFIHELTRSCYSLNNGRPSVDPEIFFRMQLIAYFYNIHSDRQLCQEIHYNLAYRWFCHINLDEKIPHHSSLTRIRDKLGIEIFKQFFVHLIKQCQIAGLIKSKAVMTDGTLFEANASLNSLVEREVNEKPSENKDVMAMPRRKRTGSEPPPTRKISNKTHISKTDPDASLAFKKGTARALKYKAHFSIDKESRVILAAKITTGATHESQVYMTQINEIENELALTLNEAIADKAYGSGEIICISFNLI